MNGPCLRIAAVVALVLASANVAAARGTVRAAKLTTDASAQPVCQPAVCPPVCVPTQICPPRCIDYRHHRFLRCKFDPCNTKQVVLQVPDYCCCCLVEVPVCVPCCCEGAPSICCHKGAFGRDVVEYSWCCGYSLKVVFNRCGDVTVHYYGL
jgi:hypothetical protein